MFADEDLLPISALQHLQYCERQCALIHVEKTWIENVLTAEGRVLHDRVDAGGNEKRGDVRRTCSLHLRSLRLGISGVADVVEFHKQSDGTWLPFPVEFKRGHPKADPCDRVQLCAQAFCLEEMKGIHIENGALFYGEPRHRCDVVFDAPLRALTESLCARLHEMIANTEMPAPVYDKRKCDRCSLIEACLPKTARRKSASAYLNRICTEQEDA